HVETAPSLDECHHGRHGQRALADGWQAVAHLDLVPEPGLSAADRLVTVCAGDVLDLVLAVSVRGGGLVLAALSSSVALGSEAPRVGLADGLAALVREGRAVHLLDGPVGERGG